MLSRKKRGKSYISLIYHKATARREDVWIDLSVVVIKKRRRCAPVVDSASVVIETRPHIPHTDIVVMLEVDKNEMRPARFVSVPAKPWTH
jgi:hypothetical protein